MTIRDQLVAGLEFLGFERVNDRPRRRFQVYRRISGEGPNWYVGLSGALRIGDTVSGSHKAALHTRIYVLTAPMVQPIIFVGLERLSPPKGAAMAELARDLQRNDDQLMELPLRVILSHVARWMKLRETA